MENLVELLERHQTTKISSKEKLVRKNYPTMKDAIVECPLYCPSDCQPSDCITQCTDCTFCEYQ